ncbi:MAG: hypothetical protein ACXVIB_02700 [Halobacteriota archaeon]
MIAIERGILPFKVQKAPKCIDVASTEKRQPVDTPSHSGGASIVLVWIPFLDCLNACIVRDVERSKHTAHWKRLARTTNLEIFIVTKLK